MRRFHFSRAALVTFAFILSASTQAAEKKQQKAGSQSDRQQMAEMHEKMAKCLRSKKPMNECQDQMMKGGGMGHMCGGMMGDDMDGHMGGMMGSGSSEGSQ